MLARFDRNKDGAIGSDEAPPALRKRFGVLDSDKDGQLSDKELAAVVAEFRRAPDREEGRKAGEVITRPAPGERPPERLSIGDEAPDFTLPLAKGEGEVHLADYRSKRPVVLIFGSISCPPFRDRVPEVESLYADYKDRVAFHLVYVREAHPDSILSVKTGEGTELRKISQTDSVERRTEHAELCTRTTGLSFPAVVDKSDNAVNRAYAGWPSRIVVVDADGSVAFDGGPGPRGFQPSRLKEWLEKHARR